MTLIPPAPLLLPPPVDVVRKSFLMSFNCRVVFAEKTGAAEAANDEDEDDDPPDEDEDLPRLLLMGSVSVPQMSTCVSYLSPPYRFSAVRKSTCKRSVSWTTSER